MSDCARCVRELRRLSIYQCTNCGGTAFKRDGMDHHGYVSCSTCGHYGHWTEKAVVGMKLPAEVVMTVDVNEKVRELLVGVSNHINFLGYAVSEKYGPLAVQHVVSGEQAIVYLRNGGVIVCHVLTDFTRQSLLTNFGMTVEIVAKNLLYAPLEAVRLVEK